MDKLAKLVTQLANTPPSQSLSTLSPLHLSLIPFLSIASVLYRPVLHCRRLLYRLRILRQHRLPVPVISVGNLTWGGNGKTPMVEFIACLLVDSRIPPLILTRGYGGADEVKMLEKHLHGTTAKIGVGVNRTAVASEFFQRYGYMCREKLLFGNSNCADSYGDQIAAAILDDGMQAAS